jgi:hypothetical protein
MTGKTGIGKTIPVFPHLNEKTAAMQQTRQ